MPDIPNCTGCVFFVRVRDFDKRGQCRRHAPILDAAGQSPKTMWPMTFVDNFCGDWRELWAERGARVLEAADAR